jgi:site-specific recombinase
MKSEFRKLLTNISGEKIHVVEKLSSIVDYLRPKNFDETDVTYEKIDLIIRYFNKKTKRTTHISDEINLMFIESKISTNITSLNILSRDGLSYEIKERFYNKFLPNPPIKGDLNYILITTFNQKDDYIWVKKIKNKKWIELFSALFTNSDTIEKTKNHLFDELLYSMEILSIWIASEEFDGNFLRLDRSLLEDDSAFIALQRDVGNFIHKIQAQKIELDSAKVDMQHLEVLIEQCDDKINKFKKKSERFGISLDLTYELERMTQITDRLKQIIKLVENFDTSKAHHEFVNLLKTSIEKNATKNSLFEVYRQMSRIVAKSITNNASEHGDHYITENTHEYIKMFFTAAGAGIIIAIMALLKINIIQAEFSQGLQTILSSLNYGIGFVFIHILGFTVATKQPAMIASSFAKAVEKEDKKKVTNQKKLVELVFKVTRSQFAAVAGNVFLALLVSFSISFLVLSDNKTLLTSEEASYYLKGLEPYSVLFFAAIAGVWLFLSGLIAGYYDNRADLLELDRRYYYQPLLKKILGDEKRKKLSKYLHEHHGAIAGNFFFGVLLGVTPYIGYLLDLPLDIAHVAFSSAYLGFAATHTDILLYEFLYYFWCVLLIGMVNLLISFILALKVSLISRDAKFGNFFSFLKLFFIEVVKHPHLLIFPFGNTKDEDKD